MFFVNKNVVKIFIKNLNVLIIDCTYKINKYKIFLITIADQILLKITFLIDFVFLLNEKQINFV